MKHAELIEQMTLEEKASLLSGNDFWHLKGIKRLSLPSIMVCDGPHGLRKQQNGAAVHESEPATCFPPSCAVAASFDPALAQRVGQAIAEEALDKKISVVLGPGANIKRSPLCGRNFEYYSEDPLLSGKMAAGFINGLQQKGVGCSLKHYCANNQETRRMTVSSVIDERTLREIYLRPFEIAVKESSPKTLMCSYNKLNGVYCSQNKKTLDDILRKEWGFDGLVMSDWGATDVREEGVKAGLNLEMPGSGGFNDKQIVAAVKNGSLDEAVLDRRVDDVVDLILYAKEHIQECSADYQSHSALSAEVAAECAVLLKNEKDMLPFSSDDRILILGEFAQKPRFQGAGSSHIVPTKLVSLIDALQKKNISFDYEKGIGKKSLSKALQKIRSGNYDKILICAGLTDQYEAEGFDRTNLQLPVQYDTLIEEAAKITSKITVLLSCGSPVLMPWKDSVSAILLSYLAGQETGTAQARLLLGESVPCGKLPESFPLSQKDVPCQDYYPGNYKETLYREALYVGYRYYTSANIPVAYAFGHGLSYTTFDYSDIEAKEDENGVDIHFTLTNTGTREAKEISQIYLSKTSDIVYYPKLSLVAFCKTKLSPNESKRITVRLSRRDFAFYNININDWCVEGGEYTLLVGKASDNLQLSVNLTLKGDGKELPDLRKTAAWYYAPNSENVPESEFFALFPSTPPISNEAISQKGNFTSSCTIEEMAETSWLARFVKKRMKGILAFSMHVKKTDPSLLMIYGTAIATPLKSISFTTQGAVNMGMVDALVTMFNGHFWKGLFELMKKRNDDQKRS